MGAIHELGEEYRCFRLEHPRLGLLFLLGDLLGLLFKLGLCLGFLYLCWYITNRNPVLENQTAATVSSGPTAVDTAELTTERIALLEKIAAQSAATAVDLPASAGSSAQSLKASLVIGRAVSTGSAERIVQVQSLPADAAPPGYTEVDEIPTVYSAHVDTEVSFLKPPAPTESSDWVLEQSADNYTVQVALTVNFDFLVEYTARLPGEYAAAIYPERRNDKSNLQYSLILGSFPSLQTAEEVLSSLPKNIKRYGAHTRKLEDIQKNIGGFFKR